MRWTRRFAVGKSKKSRRQAKNTRLKAVRADLKHERDEDVNNTVPAEKPAPEPPKLARRRENRASTFKMGRTIAEKRERLETANEREQARRKDKKLKATRVLVTIIVFLTLAGILAYVFFFSFGGGEGKVIFTPDDTHVNLTPTIEIIDENSAAGGVTSRMTAYIALAEKDFRDAGFTPKKAVIPAGAVREVDFYLADHSGYVKMTIDRDPAVSVEDVDRLYRYLTNINQADVLYLDVRLDGKAYYLPTPTAEPVEEE